MKKASTLLSNFWKVSNFPKVNDSPKRKLLLRFAVVVYLNLQGFQNLKGFHAYAIQQKEPEAYPPRFFYETPKKILPS
ncbi:MAG: hypothetical protein GDA51_05245 [Ekhidna sp.]|nr:hypothetical protein [Ekhidna sp.]